MQEPQHRGGSSASEAAGGPHVNQYIIEALRPTAWNVPLRYLSYNRKRYLRGTTHDFHSGS